MVNQDCLINLQATMAANRVSVLTSDAPIDIHSKRGLPI